MTTNDDYLAIHENGRDYVKAKYPPPDMMQEVLPFSVECMSCFKVYVFDVEREAMLTWLEDPDRPAIQVLFPDLSVSKRELIMTRTCGPCFDDMFKNDEEE